MSVWKAREFWDAPIAQEDTKSESQIAGLTETRLPIQCSRGCLALVRLSDKPSSDIIVLGTWSGTLRGFYPDETAYTAQQLLFEKELDEPILQVESANFILGSISTTAFQLAVLHPSTLTICYYSSGKTTEEAASLTVLRTYNLKASASSMVYGAFGGTRGRQMICIAMMDGRFTLIDQETVLETPVLEDFLFPGPLCYLSARDSFVIGSSCWTADCYSYSEMASKAGLVASKPDQQTRLRKSWSYNCAESLVDIKCASDDPKSPLLLLGGRHLFWLDQNGQMCSIRRLDCSPSFLSMYPTGNEGLFNMIMGTTIQTIFVYEGMIPKWTSQLPFSVVDIRVAKIASAEGILVALSEDGHISAYYLGTDPEVYETKATAATRKFNEEEIKVETSRLAEIIKQFEAGSGDAAVSPAFNEPSAITVEVGAFADITFAFDPRSGGNQRLPSSKAQVTLTPRNAVLSNVQVDVQMDGPFAAGLSQSFIERLDRSLTVTLTVQNTLQASPQSLLGYILVQYSEKEADRLQKDVFSIPFGLVAQSAPLSKKAMLKLDFDIAPEPIKLANIFPDFGPQEDNLGLSIDFYGSGLVTILISKRQETKVRIQSDDPSLLAIVGREFQRRVAFIAPGSSILCGSSLPSQEFEGLTAEKSQLKTAYQASVNDLTLWTNQLFVVEKRFLARLKDRDISVVNKLEELLEETQEKIVEVVEQCETTQKALETIRTRMTAMVALMCWLISLNNKNLSPDDMKKIELIVHGSSEETGEESWEKRSGQSAKYYAYRKLAQDNVSSSIMYQTDFSDPISLLKRAYLGQLDVGSGKKKEPGNLTATGMPADTPV